MTWEDLPETFNRESTPTFLAARLSSSDALPTSPGRGRGPKTRTAPSVALHVHVPVGDAGAYRNLKPCVARSLLGGRIVESIPSSGRGRRENHWRSQGARH